MIPLSTFTAGKHTLEAFLVPTGPLSVDSLLLRVWTGAAASGILMGDS